MTPQEITTLLSKLEPAAAASGDLAHLVVANYSIAISLKRIADFLDACGARGETDIALSGKSNGSEH